MIATRVGVVLLFVHALTAATLVVGPGGRYNSIREAIARAAAGDTVQIERGTYPGSLVLDKPLTLAGVGLIPTDTGPASRKATNAGA